MATAIGAIALVPQAAIAQGVILEPNVPRTEPRRARQEQLQEFERQLDAARERQLQRFEPRRDLESDRADRLGRSREFRQQVRQDLRQQRDRLERRQRDRRRELLRRQSR